MKTISLTLFVLLFLSISVNAQTVDYKFMKSLVALSDSSANVSIRNSGYRALPQGEYQFVKDNRILQRVYFVKGNVEADQKNTYWAFQARGKKEFSGLFKNIKKGAVKKEGTRFGKSKTEYKSKDGLYFYPFEDSSIKNFYWIYASKESLLD